MRYLDDAGHRVFAGVFLPDSIATLRSEQSERVIPIRLDVTDPASVTECAKIIGDEVAHLDGVVNNAGLLVTPGPTEWTTLDSFRRMYDVNVLGLVAVTKSVLPLIRKGRGRIVNVASIAGRMGLPNQPAYCATKFAVEGFSDVLRKEMMPWGVTVHIIEPGVFNKTGLYDTYTRDFEKMWDALPASVQRDYGETYYRTSRGTQKDVLHKMGNTDSTLVPKAMVHALLDAKPKYRYRVGLDSWLLIRIVERLSEGIQDSIFKPRGPHAAGLEPAAAPKDGYASAAARYQGNNLLKWMLGAGLAAWGVKKYRSRL